MITRKKKHKKNSEKNKIIFSIIAASGIVITSTSYAFGEADVSTLVTNWYQTKITEAKDSITQAALTKTEIEKAKLIEQIRTDIENSTSEIVHYSEQKSAEVQLAIEQKRKEVEEEMKKKNEEDKDKVKDQIDQSTEDQLADINKDKDKEKDKEKEKDKDSNQKDEPKKDENQPKDDSNNNSSNEDKKDEGQNEPKKDKDDKKSE
ncbi:hypothetical protein V7056_10840 [Bacillus sp. JJ664]